MKRVKSLDGIRAISILMVTAGHSLLTLPPRYSESKIILLFSNAALGVQIFFVISGYLITKLLLAEKEKTGKIDIRDFYIRRVLRIFPVFFLYILVLILLKWSVMPDVFQDYRLIFFAAFYLWNYKHYFIQENPADHGNFYMSHFWSLSMEEQFYLFWPITMIKANQRLLIRIAICIIVIMPFIRVMTYFLMPGSRPQVSTMLHTGGDTIIMGCLGALIESSALFKGKILPMLRKNIIIILISLFLFVLSPILIMYFRGVYQYTIGQTLNNISILMLLYWAIHVPTKISIFLNHKIMVHIGVLSYSLYIWQPLFLTEKTSFWVNQFPQNILVVFVVALISYYWIEKPILSFKKSFKKV